MSRRLLQVGILTAVVLGIATLNLLIAGSPAKDTEAEKDANSKPVEVKPGEKSKPSVVQLSESKAPTEKDIRKSLETPVEVAYEADHLNVVIKEIAKATGTNIWIDQEALAEEGVALDEAITLKSKPLAAARVLDRILDPLGLRWIIHDYVVQITTILAAEEVLFTVTYPVGDLIEYAKKQQKETVAGVGETPLQYVQFGGDMKGICGACLNPLPDSAFGPEVWLIDLLQQMTSGPWVDVDGTGGTISFLNNNLVIRQTHRVHMEIAKILSTIRDFTKGELKPAAIAVRPPHYASDEDEIVKRALAKVISVKCEDVPLQDFLEDMGNKLGIPVHLDKQALAEEGVAVNEPINLDLKNLPAESILQIVLKPLGITSLVDDGWLLVTTIIAAEERIFAKIHDIRDLNQGGYSRGTLLDVFVNETSGPWWDVDGTGGEIAEPLNGLLVVRQTEKVHNEVAAILADLRMQMAESPTKPEKKDPPDPQAVSTKFYTLEGHSDWDAIQEGIMKLVEPKSWSKNGGEGEIVLINNLLVVKTRNEVQTKVQDFLKELDKAHFPYQYPKHGGGMGGGMGGETSATQRGGGFFQVPPAKQKVPGKQSTI